MFLAFEPFKGKIPVDPKWDRDYVVLMCVTKDDDMQGPTYGHAYRDTPHGWRYNLGNILHLIFTDLEILKIKWYQQRIKQMKEKANNVIF